MSLEVHDIDVTGMIKFCTLLMTYNVHDDSHACLRCIIHEIQCVVVSCRRGATTECEAYYIGVL